MSEEQPRRGDSRELTKFGILVIIFLVVILVIAMFRPLIFEQIVPAVLGMDQPQETQLPVAPVVPQPVTPAPTSPVTATPIPAGGEIETVVAPTMLPTVSGPADTPTPAITTHTVQQGETLYQIATIYGVSVADLAAANNIVNPNQIAIGTELIIPR